MHMMMMMVVVATSGFLLGDRTPGSKMEPSTIKLYLLNSDQK